ncbi:hypothetical protein DRJ16_04970, partial [Candidatus Woesearchaeota archaeon]
KIIKKKKNLRDLIENLPMGIMVLQPLKGGRNFVIKTANSTVEIIERKGKKQLINKKLTDILPQAEKCGLLEALKNSLLQESKSRHLIIHHQSKDIDIWREIFLYKLPSGNIAMFYKDITSQKKLEIELKESEKKYRLIADNTSDIIFIQNNKAKLEYVSPAVEKITGYSVEETMKLPMRKMMSRKSYLQFLKDFNKNIIKLKLRRINEISPKQYEYIRKDGSRFWGELKMTPLFDKDGKLRGVQGILRDITERKRMEDELKKSKEFLDLIIENSPNSLWVADSNGTLIKQNEANRRLFGVTDSQVVGKYNIFKDEELIKRGLIPTVKRVFKKGESVNNFILHYDFSKIKHIKGQKFKGAKWIDVTLAPIKDSKGKVVNVIIQHRDITAQKEAEDALRQKAEELEKFSEFAVGRELAMVELKNQLDKLLQKCGKKPQFKFKARKNILKRRYKETAMLNIVDDLARLNRKLAEANRELKQLDKAKSNFLNLVSHELKTPLTAIFAHLGVLEDIRNTSCASSLNAIKRNSRQLKNLIDNILEIARMEAGKFELVMSYFDLKSLIENVIKDISILSERKKLKLFAEVGDLPQIYSDQLRVKEILINLIGNAIKFTDKGHIKVKAKKEGKFIKIEVQDTGVGIPKDKIGDLFKKFYQVDSSLSRKYGGTGLGLSISKQLTEALGGSIGVTSQPGKGSLFYFTLPISSTNKKGETK